MAITEAKGVALKDWDEERGMLVLNASWQLEKLMQSLIDAAKQDMDDLDELALPILTRAMELNIIIMSAISFNTPTEDLQNELQPF